VTYLRAAAAMTTLALLAGCAQPPMGPTVQVMPAPNKPFQVFQEDDAVCRQFAQQQSAGAAERGNNQQVGTAVVGTLLGAGRGAAIGGGRGAAIGAAGGAVVGTGVGSNAAGRGEMTAQQFYNTAYSQCMYSKGNQVPGYVPAYSVDPPPPPPPPPPYR
jgi:uncharacterized protein YcfJ